MRMRPSKSIRFMILSPFLLAIIAWWLYTQVFQPQPFYVNADPEIPYLMSSLAVFKGEPYAFIDHPGTPVEIIGTLIFSATYPFIGNSVSSFTLSHILHPDTFLIIARSLLTLASMGTMVLLGLCMVPGSHWTDQLAAVACAVLFFGIHPWAFDSIVHWSHNSFSFPVGSLLGLGMVLLVVDKNGGSKQQIAILGFSFGILVAIQLYFVTWIVGAVVAFSSYSVLSMQGWKKALVSSLRITLAAIAGFIVATIPILNKYPDFVSWIFRVASHQGRHGSGPPGFMSVQSAVINFYSLWSDLRLLIISVGVVVVLIAVMAFLQRHNLKSNTGLWAIALGLIAQIGVMSALVIKHPGIIYMQAIAATFPLLLAVAISLMGISIPKMTSTQRLIKFGLSIGIFFLFSTAFFRAIIIHSKETKQVQYAVEEINDFLDDLALDQGRDQQAFNRLWVYGMPSECQALWYGNHYTGYTLSVEVGSICPRDLVFDLWENRVVLSDGSSVQLDRFDWDIIVVTEAALIDFPDLAEVGRLVYSHASLGTFGKVVYILPSHD